ncbi:DUF916 and DUF3324 domain-containing protein [Listeria booriae]|uniref:DUF916 and DUF3324 domain-containing protein n=1 Tax=Listeria booriae TaxID=1552123 RepID=UPI001623A383|nr:DUF916 and DUF3324 domain-containing protein [Listeria booriae]MBC2324569.1 DUF916 and DUF3324 domain-containing protein [Listeria booriae]
MRKNVIKIIGLIPLMILITLALKTEVSASELNFSVKTIIPHNQIDTQKSYFDLQLTPNQDQILVVQLSNDTEKAVTVQPDIHSAFTNLNGLVEYGKNIKKTDPSLHYDIKNLITTASEVTIPAKSVINLELQLDSPKEKFHGVIAGGITFKEKTPKEEVQTNTNSISINNEYAYIIGIVLHSSKAFVEPKLQLASITPDQVNSRNVISVNIRNIQPIYMNRMTISSEIMQKGKQRILYQSYSEKLQMAPNSNFDYPIYLKDKMPSGNYTLNMTAKSMGRTWYWTEDFSISKNQANELNDKDVTIDKSFIWHYVLLGLITLITMCIIIIIVNRRKKDEQEEEIR